MTEDADTSRVVRVLLLGPGSVGRSFVSLVADRHDEVERRYGIDVRFVGIATSSATWLPPTSITRVDARRVLTGADATRTAERTLAYGGERAIREIGADVLVDATSGSLANGEPAASRIRLAMGRRMHVVLASKGALVWHFRELQHLARRSGIELRIGAATGAALPTLDVARYGLAGATITRIDGILNGTSNYVLTRMARDRSTFAEALGEARRLGVAEADPSADVEGIDTASKLVLIANALWDAGLRLDDVAVRGIIGIRPSRLERASRRGRTVRLVGTLRRGIGGWQASVRPTSLPPEHPLAPVDGLEKAVTFLTDTMDRITVIGGRSDPTGAAAALLRDIINLSADDRRR